MPAAEPAAPTSIDRAGAGSSQLARRCGSRGSGGESVLEVAASAARRKVACRRRSAEPLRTMRGSVGSTARETTLEVPCGEKLAAGARGTRPSPSEKTAKSGTVWVGATTVPNSPGASPLSCEEARSGKDGGGGQGGLPRKSRPACRAGAGAPPRTRYVFGSHSQSLLVTSRLARGGPRFQRQGVRAARPLHSSVWRSGRRLRTGRW